MRCFNPRLVATALSTYGSGKKRLKYAPATVNKMLIALRRVLGEAHKLGEFSDYEKATAISPLRNTSPLRGRSLSKEEIAALMKTCDAQEPRDTAIIAVLRGSGVRRTELVNLDLFDVDLQSGKLLIRSGKGGKPRTCYIPESTISFVQKWLTVRGMEPGPLFCRVYKGGRLKLGRLVADSIWRMLKKRGEMAGLAPFSPHDFRRTFCSDLMDCNVDLVTVQKLVGHSSPLTTTKYDRRGEKTKQRAVQNLDF